MQLASDPIARFVEMANCGLGDALADGLVDGAQLSRLPAHPGDDAGRADRRRAEQIAQSLRDAILGDQLLDIEIDCEFRFNPATYSDLISAAVPI